MIPGPMSASHVVATVTVHFGVTIESPSESAPPLGVDRIRSPLVEIPHAVVDSKGRYAPREAPGRGQAARVLVQARVVELLVRPLCRIASEVADHAGALALV